MKKYELLLEKTKEKIKNKYLELNELFLIKYILPLTNNMVKNAIIGKGLNPELPKSHHFNGVFTLPPTPINSRVPKIVYMSNLVNEKRNFPRYSLNEMKEIQEYNAKKYAVWNSTDRKWYSADDPSKSSTDIYDLKEHLNSDSLKTSDRDILQHFHEKGIKEKVTENPTLYKYNASDNTLEVFDQPNNLSTIHHLPEVQNTDIAKEDDELLNKIAKLTATLEALEVTLKEQENTSDEKESSDELLNKFSKLAAPLEVLKVALKEQEHVSDEKENEQKKKPAQKKSVKKKVSTKRK